MNEQWPSERRAEKRTVFADSSFKTAQDFVTLMRLLSEAQLTAFDEASIWIMKQQGTLSELKQRSLQLSTGIITSTFPDTTDMLMTLACAAALARSPSLLTWVKVNTFKYNSWQLEHWLGEAMIAYAEVNAYACHDYTRLAKDVFAALGNFSLKSKSERVNQEREGAWINWKEGQDKLEEIWWSLRGWHGFMNYEEELPLFQVYYKLEPDEFIHTISSSSNPYLVSALLFVAGIGAFSPRFSEWKRMIAAAPVAFERDGTWNSSVLLPLLLVEARNQLSHTSQNLHHSSTTHDELEQIKQEMKSTARLITNSLSEREDYPAIISRWTPWLMRKILGQTAKESNAVNFSAFADEALIDVIGSELNGSLLPQTSPEDAPSWEAWCYRCVQSSFAYNGHMQVQDWTSFADEWSLSPEDWAGQKGQLLRERASLITAINKEIPGIAASSLAYPIAQSPAPTEAWISLWNNAMILREIVEFGDSDATVDEYSSRSEAGRLLFLLFRIGLAIFDQGAARTTDNNSPEARSLAILFNALNLATQEMREIDTTLNYDEWLSIVQHLAVRRMIWESTSGNEKSSASYQVFNNGDTPTVSNILAASQGNVVELISILESILCNNPDVSRLKADLNSASIDLSSIVNSMRSLNQYHLRKYPIDEAQLQKLEALI